MDDIDHIKDSLAEHEDAICMLARALLELARITEKPCPVCGGTYDTDRRFWRHEDDCSLAAVTHAI